MINQIPIFEYLETNTWNIYLLLFGVYGTSLQILEHLTLHIH